VLADKAVNTKQAKFQLVENLIHILEITIMNKSNLISALGGAATISMLTMPVVQATENPFTMQNVTNATYLAKGADGKCGEGKCGDKTKEGACNGSMDKTKEGKCGEGKCGDGKMKEGGCNGSKDETDTTL
jgi:uncharacterized low-complexity protein